MQLVYLETATLGLRWFKQYYAQRPELNWQSARNTLKASIATIKTNPHSGRKFDHFETVYERKLAKTHFSLLYTIQNETIYVIDVRDQRRLRSAAALQVCTTELRERCGL